MPDFCHLEESDEESSSEFEKFIESICTPRSNAIVSQETSESEEDETAFLKLIERIRTPCSTTVSYQKETSESEDEETEFLKFCQRIRTPYSINVNHGKDINSASSPGFPEKQRLMYSPKGDSEDSPESIDVSASTQNTLQSQIISSQHSARHISSDNRRLRTKKDTSSGSVMHCASVIISSDSEDEESEFLKFSERIRQTPQYQMSHSSNTVFKVPKSISKNSSDDQDDDEVFLKVTENFQKLGTPRSQNRNNTRQSMISESFPEKQKLFHSSSEGSSNQKSFDGKSGQHSLEVYQSRNKEEFSALFPTVSSVLFCRKREKYAQQLFDFFNRKIFDFQLPKDLPLIWDNSLAKTAGLTICSRKSNVYTCSIKLSSKLLISFDRLQDTLLHEMCHAAVWIINNIESVNHGPLWKIWGSRCKMILPFIECPEKCHTYDVPYSIWYRCLSCNWKKGRFRHSQKLANSICKKCRKPLIVTRT